MTYIGKVKDGVVVLRKSAELPEGTVVRVLPVKRTVKSRKRKAVKARKGRKTESLSEMFLSLAGTVKGLPSDYAENHDHYAHGTPKRTSKKKQESLAEFMLRYSGFAKGLPQDMAHNHDHYLHGTPKK
jgi:hypothetical protein